MKNNRKQKHYSYVLKYYLLIILFCYTIFANELSAKPLTKEEIDEQFRIVKEYWNGDEKALNRVISNVYGRNGLHYAAVHNDILQLKRLFLEDRSKEINQKDRAGYTPIALAAENRKIGAATILMEHGANPFIKNEAGESAVDLAKKNKSKEMLAILIGGHRPTK